jgi:methylated-DNA-[protein]-cysteine S-methyltransferase
VTSSDPVTSAQLDSPLGAIEVSVNRQGALVAVRFLNVRDAAPPLTETGCERAVKQLGEYFRSERRRFELELEPEGTDFEHRVWSEVRRIPFGATDTYGEIARRLGDPDAAIIVPCHRVIGSDGDLTGYAGGLDRKRWLLDMESGQARLDF